MLGLPKLTFQHKNGRRYSNKKNHAHRHNQHGDLVSTTAQTALRNPLRSGHTVDHRKMCRTGHGQRIQVFGFWVRHRNDRVGGVVACRCMLIGDSILWMRWQRNVGVVNAVRLLFVGGAGRTRFLMDFGKILQIRYGQQQ
jgi:hypothetical protein